MPEQQKHKNDKKLKVLGKSYKTLKNNIRTEETQKWENIIQKQIRI